MNNKYIRDLEELIKHLSELYYKYKPVKEYLDYYVNPDEMKLLEEYENYTLWLGEVFDPYDFKIDEINKKLREEDYGCIEIEF